MGTQPTGDDGELAAPPVPVAEELALVPPAVDCDESQADSSSTKHTIAGKSVNRCTCTSTPSIVAMEAGPLRHARQVTVVITVIKRYKQADGRVAVRE